MYPLKPRVVSKLAQVNSSLGASVPVGVGWLVEPFAESFAGSGLMDVAATVCSVGCFSWAQLESEEIPSIATAIEVVTHSVRVETFRRVISPDYEERVHKC